MVAPEQIPVPGSGSVEICILAIARRLAQKHEVTIVSRQSPHLSGTSRIGNVTIIRVPTGTEEKYTASVLEYIRDKTFDVIQVDNRPHCMAQVKSAAPHTPVVLFLHSLTFVPRRQKVADSLRHADLIIANSRSLKQNLSRMFPICRHVIRTVHLGVDLARFSTPTTQQKWRSKRTYKVRRSFTVLFAGRVIPRKGVNVLLDAMSIVRKVVPFARLLIAGRGSRSYVGSLKAHARRLRVPARFMGKIRHDNIHRIYRAADCFVCPSQRHEAFGLVNVEAMATGVPVIASNIGGIKEIVKHRQNGYLINDYRNPLKFALPIIELARNRRAAKKMGGAARRTALSRFSWRRTAAKLEKLYARF
ncbi:glycosyltransferase family 4 protein [Paenibacillus xerothermodurans]|nr:glycosyltransferase family 4 protein [Paenibacillus xerothermodurans]